MSVLSIDEAVENAWKMAKTKRSKVKLC